MRLISLLLQAAVVSAAVLEVRQLGNGRAGKTASKGAGVSTFGGAQGKFGTAKVAGTKQLKAVVSPKATREITRFGPLTVNGVS